MSKQLIILGGGPCGLFGAHKGLELGAQVTLLEKTSSFGGLAAGRKLEGNWYDLGVHMLHAFDQEVFEVCAEAMGQERLEVPLKSHIRWNGKLYHYPLRGRDILAGIPPFTLARCMGGVLLAGVLERFGKATPGADAESALIELYGDPLYEFFFEEFTHRYWGIHPRQLSAEFVRRKMPRLSAIDVFKNLLEKLRLANPKDAAEGALRSETLHYSRTGSETLPRSLARKIESLGAALHLNSPITRIHHDQERIISVETPSSRLCGSHFLSTIPIPELVRSLTPKAPPEVLNAAQNLKFKAMTVYTILVKKEKCMDALYTYYRDRIFHRVGEPKNAGLIVTPHDHTTLIVELTCEPGDARWTGEAWPAILRDLELEGICREDEVVNHHLIRETHAYPIFNLDFERSLTKVNRYLERFRNLRSTGRQGGFSYPNMHSAMRMGASAVQELISP